MNSEVFSGWDIMISATFKWFWKKDYKLINKANIGQTLTIVGNNIVDQYMIL